MLERLQKLTLYLEGIRIELDNNQVKNMLRP